MEDGRYLVEKGNIRNFMNNFEIKMREKGYSDEEITKMAGGFFSDKIVLKYTNDEQDLMWDEIYNISQQPGGIRYLMDRMDYMPVFVHRRFRNLKSINNSKTYKQKNTL
jgi:hypothetical protein